MMDIETQDLWKFSELRQDIAEKLRSVVSIRMTLLKNADCVRIFLLLIIFESIFRRIPSILVTSVRFYEQSIALDFHPQ